jgi:threonine efflux protein
MMDVMPALKIAPIFLIALISPGPDFFLISSMALSRGRPAGVLASFGIAAGTTLWALLCMFGLGLIFAKMQGLVVAIRLCGGVYLLYLGYQLWKASFHAAPVEAAPPLPHGKRRNPFTVGLATNVTNPKALAFFTSIFAFALPQGASLATQGAIVALVAVLAAGWFSLVSFCLSTPAMRKVYMRWSRWIDRVAGTFLAFFGVRLLASFRN